MVSSALKVMKPEETHEPSSVIEEMVRASVYNTEARIVSFANAWFIKFITYIPTK